MMQLTDEEKSAMSISNLMTYAELLNAIKQELTKLESEE